MLNERNDSGQSVFPHISNRVGYSFAGVPNSPNFVCSGTSIVGASYMRLRAAPHENRKIFGHITRIQAILLRTAASTRLML